MCAEPRNGSKQYFTQGSSKKGWNHLPIQSSPVRKRGKIEQKDLYYYYCCMLYTQYNTNRLDLNIHPRPLPTHIHTPIMISHNSISDHIPANQKNKKQALAKIQANAKNKVLLPSSTQLNSLVRSSPASILINQLIITEQFSLFKNPSGPNPLPPFPFLFELM